MNREPEKGTALLVTMSLLFLITLLGLSAFRWANDELGIAANQKATTQAQYIAESGVALMLQWFQEPATFPEIGTFPSGYPSGDRSSFLKRRKTDSRGAPSFFDAARKSQFTGTSETPDFWYQSGLDATEFLGEVFTGMGTLTGLKLFGPTTIGALCTVEATGTTLSGINRTVSVEMIPSPIPPTTAAIQVGRQANAKVPILVHWGDVRVIGDADLGDSLLEIPKKDRGAPVTGEPYAPSDRRDGWLDFWVGGAILNPETTAYPDCTEPFLCEGYEEYKHLHQFQARIQPDFRLDPWDYQRLKDWAKAWGTYYTTDPEGFLYRDGINDQAHRMTPSQALASEDIGDDRGFVFIDTVDQKPPDGTNLATLDLPVNYLEGIFFIQAHVVLRESGSGQSIQVQSPPDERSNDPLSRSAVVLSNIHLKGTFSVAGQLTVEGHPNIFGALITQQGFSGSGQPEVWYDADLGTGYHRGLPAVTVLRGSWYLR